MAFSMRSAQSLVAFAIAAITLPGVAQATEGGATIWPIGIHTVFPGMNPAPGDNMFYSYTAWISANRLNNGQGDSVLSGVDVDVYAQAIRALHTWDYTYGPFSFTSGIATTFVHTSVELGPVGSGTATGLQSILLEPLYVNYISPDKTLFVNAALLFNIPAGSYDPDNFVNVGSHVWTIMPNINVTYLFTPRLNASVSISNDIRSKNTDTEYRSGITFNLDYSLMYAPIESMPNIFLGVQGNWTTQLTDDKVDGIVYNDGNHLEIVSVGPQIVYLMEKGGVALKWQHEVLAKNGTQGDRLWLQFALPF